MPTLEAALFSCIPKDIAAAISTSARQAGRAIKRRLLWSLAGQALERPASNLGYIGDHDHHTLNHPKATWAEAYLSTHGQPVLLASGSA